MILRYKTLSPEYRNPLSALKRLYQALDIVNQSYGDNLALKNVRIDRGLNPQFTLTVKSSQAQGSRLGRLSGYTKEGKPKQRHM
jgi:hypothetical protein